MTLPPNAHPPTAAHGAREIEEMLEAALDAFNSARRNYTGVNAAMEPMITVAMRAALAAALPPVAEGERGAEVIKRLVTALADCVAKATEYGQQDGGFVSTYIIPTGPIHRAIPLLQEHGLTIRPGFDGRVPLTPEQEKAVEDYVREMNDVVIPEIVATQKRRASLRSAPRGRSEGEQG